MEGKHEGDWNDRLEWPTMAKRAGGVRRNGLSEVNKYGEELCLLIIIMTF